MKSFKTMTWIFALILSTFLLNAQNTVITVEHSPGKLIVDGKIISEDQVIKVGKNIPAGQVASFKAGEGRLGAGNATVELFNDSGLWKYRALLESSGAFQFQQKGTSPFVFNKLDGGSYFFQFQGTNRLLVNAASVHPAQDGIYSLGISTRKFKEVWATNGVIQTSMLSSKENIEDIETTLDRVLKLRPVSYNYIGQDRDKEGLIAEEVELVFPNVVYEDSEGNKGINYSELVPVLIKAIQEQQELIETLIND